jgi:hypothetical protein
LYIDFLGAKTPASEFLFLCVVFRLVYLFLCFFFLVLCGFALATLVGFECFLVAFFIFLVVFVSLEAMIVFFLVFGFGLLALAILGGCIGLFSCFLMGLTIGCCGLMIGFGFGAGLICGFGMDGLKLDRFRVIFLLVE